MIKWKSLILFFVTLGILLGGTGYALWLGYNEALGFLALKHPEINITPESAAIYTPDPEVARQLEEYDNPDIGYTLKLPKNYTIFQDKNDPKISFMDKDEKWEVVIYPKLQRFDDSIVSDNPLADRFLPNATGDYYILLEQIFKNTKDPILLFQKMQYLPSDATHIKKIRTPYFFGFYIVGKSGTERTEVYRLFDDEYWHNIMVYIYDGSYPHEYVQNIIASLKNLESPSAKTEENKGE